MNGLEGTSFYDILPSGSGSKVVWGFDYETSANPIRRWRGLMLDRLVGNEFQTGLAALKDRVETDRRPAAAPEPGAEGAPAPAPSAAPATTAVPAERGVSTAVPQQPAPVQEQRRPKRP
jgi:hypothetical protein